MKIIRTDGTNPDFMLLCGLLDDYLNELVGGEKQRQCYTQFNLLNDIHDVVLLYLDGTAAACAAFKHYQAGIAELKRVFVRGDYRRKGLSKILLREIESIALQKGYHTMILETGELLKEASALYLSSGYFIIENYGQYRDMRESVCMQKRLR